MKTSEEIEQLAEKYYPPYPDGIITDEIRALREGFIKGYRCQEDMADMKYTEEDMVAFAYQFSSINVSDFRKHLKDFDLNLKEKNKQD